MWGTPWRGLEGPRELIWIDPHAKYVRSAARPALFHQDDCRKTFEPQREFGYQALVLCQKAVRLCFYAVTSTQGRLSPSSAVWTCFDSSQLLFWFSLFLEIKALSAAESRLTPLTHTCTTQRSPSTGLPAWLSAGIDLPSRSYVTFCALVESLVL